MFLLLFSSAPLLEVQLLLLEDLLLQAVDKDLPVLVGEEAAAHAVHRYADRAEAVAQRLSADTADNLEGLQQDQWTQRQEEVIDATALQALTRPLSGRPSSPERYALQRQDERRNRH